MPLPTSYADFELHRRALDALRNRQQAQASAAREQGQPLPFWALEQPDPNFGMMNDLAQGIEETSGGGRSKVRFRAIQGLRGAGGGVR